LAAILLLLSQLTFVINFFWSLVRGTIAERNPWQANTLEWTTDSPPPHENFATIPVVLRGPYDYSSPETADDWISQDQPLTKAKAAAH
jgi:cytochrome c oxidase subunit 1